MRSWRWLAAALALIFFSHSAIAAKPEAQILYEEGVSARRAGNFRVAIERLEASLRVSPDNPEALHLLGSVYGFVQRFDEAMRVLDQARRLAPEDTEIQLTLARTRAFRQDFAGAEMEVNAILAREPGNVEALNLSGRIAYYQSKLAEAEAAFRAALARDPANLEASLGLGDIAAARNDAAGAQKLYRNAQQVDPGSRDAAERLERLPKAGPRWQLDTAVSVSGFSRQSRKRWLESFDQLSFQYDGATTFHGRAELSQRFSAIDTYLQAGVDRRLNEGLSAYLYAGFTPDADFRERWAVLAGGSARLLKGAEKLGATLLTLDGAHANYATGSVDKLSPGLQQYFWGGSVWVTGKFINTWDEDRNHLEGYLAQLDWQATPKLHLLGGHSRAPETVANVTVETSALFFGAAFNITPLYSVRLDYAHEDREDSYIRHALTLSFRAKL